MCTIHEIYSHTYAIEIKKNKARHNLSNVKYRQMALQSVDGAVVGSFLEPLSQTKVMHSHQRKLTWSLFWFVLISVNKMSWVNLVSAHCARSQPSKERVYSRAEYPSGELSQLFGSVCEPSWPRGWVKSSSFKAEAESALHCWNHKWIGRGAWNTQPDATLF